MAKGANRLPASQSPFRAACLVDNVKATIGAQVGSAINIAAVMQDANFEQIAERGSVFVYLSDDALGLVLTATAPASVAIGTNGLLITEVAVKAFDVVSTMAGLFDITITKTGGTPTWYINFVMPDGKVQTIGPITFT